MPFISLAVTRQEAGNDNTEMRVISNFRGLRWPVYKAVQATAAAPSYFPSVRFQGEEYVDGGLVANNPTSIALHQAKDLVLLEIARRWKGVE